MARTRKPCPGCGRDANGAIWRKSDEVCAECQRLLAEALEARRVALTTRAGRSLVMVPAGANEWPTFSRGTRESGEALRAALFTLGALALESAPGHHQGEPGVVRVPRRPNRRGRCRVGTLPTNFAATLSDLDEAITAYGLDCYEGGRKAKQREAGNLAERMRLWAGEVEAATGEGGG